jgi:hypothetical protein
MAHCSFTDDPLTNSCSREYEKYRDRIDWEERLVAEYFGYPEPCPAEDEVGARF